MAAIFVIDGQLLDADGNCVGTWVVTSRARLWTYDTRRSLACSWMRDDGLVGDRQVISRVGLEGIDRLYPHPIAEA